MKIGWAISLSLLVGLLVWVYMEYFYLPSQTVTIKRRGNLDVVLLKLPNSHDPDIFGAPFWEARHALAKLTPCPACRFEAVEHEKFFHDWVNRKTKKDIKFPENFDEWVKRICRVNSKGKNNG